MWLCEKQHLKPQATRMHKQNFLETNSNAGFSKEEPANTSHIFIVFHVITVITQYPAYPGNTAGMDRALKGSGRIASGP